LSEGEEFGYYLSTELLSQITKKDENDKPEIIAISNGITEIAVFKNCETTNGLQYV
jgi:hypothetical protein